MNPKETLRKAFDDRPDPNAVYEEAGDYNGFQLSVWVIPVLKADPTYTRAKVEVTKAGESIYTDTVDIMRVRLEHLAKEERKAVIRSKALEFAKKNIDNGEIGTDHYLKLDQVD